MHRNCGISCAVRFLHKSIAGRSRPVRAADEPITARYRFIKNASWVGIFTYMFMPDLIVCSGNQCSFTRFRLLRLIHYICFVIVTVLRSKFTFFIC